MPGWDYSRNGYYYVTMVIKEFDPILGHIENGEMILSEFGEIAFDEWIKSFEIRDELIMDEFIFMPDHMHAIIIIKNTDGNADGNGHIQTHGRASLASPASPPSDPNDQFKLHRSPKSLSSFIAGYKSAVTTKIDDFIDLHDLPIPKYNRNNRLWQINYHDHIIRDDGEYRRIKKYIIDNPKNWKK